MLLLLWYRQKKVRGFYNVAISTIFGDQFAKKDRKIFLRQLKASILLHSFELRQLHFGIQALGGEFL
jgi:hypothetical protein